MPASAWICPECDRRVPRAVDVCRCGHARTGVERPIADADDAPVVGTTPPRTQVPAAMVVILLGVVAAAVATRTRPAETRPQPAVSAPTAAAVQDGAADPQAIASGRGAPRWPDDPTLWRESVPTAAAPVEGAARVAAPAGSLEDVISGALPAVALVETPGGRGTGFFVAPDTLITNAHVVESHSYVTVKLSTGEVLSARVVQRADDLDLAAIRTTETSATQATLALGSSRDARIGQEVIAIGSPLGLQNTVTRGIVSALRQAGSVVLIQTDAAINPGNSGGPILDRSGRVLAVATMRMGGRAEALGFGVAGEHVRALLDGRAPSATRASTRPADAFAPNRDADGDRETGEAAYERFLVEASRRADRLDASWRDFVADCLAGKAPATRSDRGWYALWEKFDDAAVSPACVRFVTDFKVAAREFEQRMTDAADRARRAGVYPGVCRQLRHRHRLDSPDW
jgi:S1-C subfamily serine protease